jgi:hypothetical protein
MAIKQRAIDQLYETRLAIGCGGGGDSSRDFFDDFFLKSGNPFIALL